MSTHVDAAAAGPRDKLALTLLPRCCASAASRRRCAELYGAAEDPRLPAPLHRRGGGRRRRAARAARPTTASSPPTASTATRWRAASPPARSWPRCSASRRAAAAAAAARCTSSTRATRFYGGNAIVGGGLPLAVGLALADKMQGRRARDRLLLRRRRGGRGRVPRVDEPGRAVEAAGALLLREQPLRDGHRARRAPSRRPTSA